MSITKEDALHRMPLLPLRIEDGRAVDAAGEPIFYSRDFVRLCTRSVNNHDPLVTALRETLRCIESARASLGDDEQNFAINVTTRAQTLLTNIERTIET